MDNNPEETEPPKTETWRHRVLRLDLQYAAVMFVFASDDKKARLNDLCQASVAFSTKQNETKRNQYLY